jgi:precorrin-6A synthase
VIDLVLIGIGTGNPDHMTRQGAKALHGADLVLIPRKGDDKGDLAEMRRAICAEVLGDASVTIAEFDLPVRDADTPDYRTRVEDWHDAIARAWEAAIRTHLDPVRGGTVAFLVWGDPSLYDSTLRIADRVARRLPLTPRVIPGITAIQALCAAHAIPFNTLGGAVTVTTGRQLRDTGWPSGAETLVVMLDAGGAFEVLNPQGLHIWWGAYVGMAQERLIAGPLAKAGPRILEARAAARAAHGWIMDVYLIRKVG